MPFKNKRKKASYHKGYWKKYYANPIHKARHLKSVRKSERKQGKIIRKWIIEFKIKTGCKICGFREHSAALDFAHRDRATKKFNISNYLHDGWSLKRVQQEASKCDILCANHHRIATYNENHGVLGEFGRPRHPVTMKIVDSNSTYPAICSRSD